MLTRVEIELKLRANKLLLQEKYKVKRIGIFGSYLHGDYTETSDVDLLVEFFEPIGWEFVDLNEYLEALLGKKVDLVTEGALKPQLREEILKEVNYQ